MTSLSDSLRSGSITSMDEAEGRPVIKRSLKPLSQNQGQPVVFEVDIQSPRRASVQWLKNNEKLSSSSRVEITSEDNKYTLTIKDTNPEDAGLYTVVASNSVGTASSSATLSVKPDAAPDSRPTSPGGTVLPHEPVFKVKLKDTELLEGTTVRFELVVRGMPCPNVTFYKNDQPLKQDDRVKVLFETREVFELVLEHVRPEDGGEFKCVAVNSEGEATTSGKISISKDKILFQGLDFDDMDVPESATEHMSNRLMAGTPGSGSSSRPRTPLFRWFKDGSEFEHTERFECQFDDAEDTIALVFQHVTPDDAGLYTCVASTSSGKISCSAELTVQGEVHRLMRDPEAPSIKATMSDVEVSEGASAMLEVKILGYPKPKIVWYKKGEEVVADERHKFLFEDAESYTLVVKNIKAADGGEYTVKASNDLGEVETKGNLIVTCAPKFKKQLRDMAIMTDDELKLQVEVEANPAPELKWFKDGQLMREGDRVKIVHETEELYALVIQKAKMEDAGNYSCVVSNSCGQQSDFGAVTVNSPPEFITGMKSVDGKAGDNVDFKVKVAGNPKPDVKFMKDKKVIVADEEHISIEEEEGTFRLKIRKVSMSDVGVYTCVVTNEYGSKSSDGELTIKSKPSFKRKLNDYEAREGDEDFELTVVLEGSPQPKVRWLYEETEIIESELYKPYIDENGTGYSLRITKVTSTMTGTYTCEAVNSEGKCDCSGKLTVLSKPAFTQKLADTSAAPEGQLVKKVKVSGNPAPDVKWLKNGSEITADDVRVIMSKESDNTYVLVINKLTIEDEGEYTCEASNVFGKATTASKVTVSGKPGFKVGLHDVSVLEDETDIELKVQTQASPFKPSIRWYIDDIEIVEIDNRYKLIPADDDVYKLLIKTANEGTAGCYKCTATNDYGEIDTTANVTVASKPEFFEGLEDREANLDEEISMTVVVAGNPKPEMKWLKDGKDVSAEATIKIEKDSDTVYVLTIAKVTATHSGVYECIIKNSVGEAKSSGKLQVLSKPRFIKDISDKTAYIGKNEFFEVEVEGNPKPQVFWLKNGKKITTQVTAENKDNKYRLRFEPIEEEDEADFQCEAVNKAGKTQSKKVHLTVKEPVVASLPKFDKKLNDATASVSDDVRFDVKVSGSPAPEVTWLKDGKPVKAGDRIKIEDTGDGGFALVISKLAKVDQGTYSCVAKNEAGEAVEKSNFTIKEPAVPSVEGPQSIEVVKDAEAQLVAKVTGVPTPEVRWLKNGVPLRASDNVVMSTDGETHKLTILKAGDGDVGEYVCRATNSVGNTEKDAAIAIRPKAPKFVRNVEDVNVALGEAVSLEAQVTGYPTPSVSWLKDKEEVVATGNILISDDGDNHKLVIKQVTADEVGKYTCKAINGAGEASSAAKVNLVELPPNILKELPPNLQVKEGNQLRLEGKVAGSPVPTVKWLKNGKEVIPSDRIKIENKPDGTSILTIDDATLEDAGKYELVAVNSQGELSSVSTVGVQSNDVRPKFVKELEKIEIAEGKKGRLEGKIIGTPTPIVKWFKDEVELDESNRLEFIHESDGTIALVIDCCSSKDAGIYKAVAHNRKGEDISLAPLRLARRHSMVSKPEFLRPLKPLDIDEGNVLKLSAQVKGDPKPTIKWLRDGEELKEDERTKFSEEPDGTVTLTIESVSVDEAGKYVVAASNDEGRTRSAASVEVNRTKPEVPKPRVIHPPSPEPEPKRPKFKMPEIEPSHYERRTIEREEYTCTSESHYQNGPDTYLLQHRDTGYPLRIREYLRVGAQRSPSLANHLRESHWGDANVAIRERRQFVAVMDEEIDDEKKGLGTRTTPMRLQREVGTSGYAYGQIYHLKQEAIHSLGTDVTVKTMPPAFREKIRDVVVRENDDAVFSCYAVGEPAPSYCWFRNDSIIIESSRVEFKRLASGRCELRLKPARAYDSGCYKCVARNAHGAVICRARLKIGSIPGRPEPPVVTQTSDSQAYLCWASPKLDGHTTTLGYHLEYKTEAAAEWTDAANNVAHEFFIVEGLQADTNYVFRVKARNKFGWGESSLDSKVAKTETAGQGSKIRLPKSRQQAMESGTKTEDEVPLVPDIDYSKESNPVALGKGEHSELYNFGSEIARGRFSIICKSVAKESGSTVVTKATLVESEADCGTNNEYEILKSLANQRVVQLLSASRGSSLFVLALEPLSGMDVLTFLSHKKEYSEEVVTEIIQQVLDGLEYLHFRGICILELQPDNVVMINPKRADIKLVDFSSARAVPSIGAKVDIKGVTEYLAPEIMKKHEVSPATDVWCVGILTYILLSGVSPFAGETEAETVENISFVRYHFDHLFKEVTQESTRFLMSIFKRTPEKRPTVEECADHKWLLPNEFMVKKRENALFDSQKLTEFADAFHSKKAAAIPPKLLTVSGGSGKSDD